MSIDYIVSSLPTLSFDAPAPMSWEAFVERTGDLFRDPNRSATGDLFRDPNRSATSDLFRGPDRSATGRAWMDLETQLRNALVEARGGAERFRRPAEGCSLFWRNRILACFQEKDVAKRDELIDRVWWDAAGELTDVTAPLGKGALATYAVRLRIALKRAAIAQDAGQAAFERLTAETKVSF